MAKTYAIVNVADYENLDAKTKGDLFNDIIQTSFETARKSLDGTKMVIKWNSANPTPSMVSTAELSVSSPTSIKADGSKTYTHAEILVEMAKAEWNDEPE